MSNNVCSFCGKPADDAWQCEECKEKERIRAKKRMFDEGIAAYYAEVARDYDRGIMRHTGD